MYIFVWLQLGRCRDLYLPFLRILKEKLNNCRKNRERKEGEREREKFNTGGRGTFLLVKKRGVRQPTVKFGLAVGVHCTGLTLAMTNSNAVDLFIYFG